MAKRGLIQVYTGEGKGKTTAALGLAMRAVGQGMKVIFIQFVKGDPNCGEHFFASKYHPFDIVQLAVGDSFDKAKEQLSADAQRTLAYAEEAIVRGGYDMVILDEIFIAVKQGSITTKQVLDLIDKKPESLELVLTGRYVLREVVQRADLVTEMLLIKHPFTEGIRARPGIEY